MYIGRATTITSSMLPVAAIMLCSWIGCNRAIPNPTIAKPSTTAQQHVLSRLDESRKYVRWACHQLADTTLVRLNMQEPGTHDVDSGAGITPGDDGAEVFVKIAAATHLKSLVLPKDTTDADLKGVGMLTQLEYLSIARCRIRGEGLRSLEGMLSLKGLDLGETFIDDNTISSLPALPSLKSLDLGGAPLSGAALGHLTLDKFPNLVELSLTGGFCDDSWVPAILEMTKLQLVNFYHTRLSDHGLRGLSEHQSLRKIGIGFTYVSDHGLAEFIKLRPDIHVDSGG